MEHSRPEQLEAGAPVGLTLEHFEPVYLAFYLPIAPDLREGCPDRGQVPRDDPLREVLQFLDSRVPSVYEPPLQLRGLPLLDHLDETPRQVMDRRSAALILVEPSDPAPLFWTQLLIRKHQRPGSAARGESLLFTLLGNAFGGSSDVAGRREALPQVAGEVVDRYYRTLVANRLDLLVEPLYVVAAFIPTPDERCSATCLGSLGPLSRRGCLSGKLPAANHR